MVPGERCIVETAIASSQQRDNRRTAPSAPECRLLAFAFVAYHAGQHRREYEDEDAVHRKCRHVRIG